jgi:hypothetical protein
VHRAVRAESARDLHDAPRRIGAPARRDARRDEIGFTVGQVRVDNFLHARVVDQHSIVERFARRIVGPVDRGIVLGLDQVRRHTRDRREQHQVLVAGAQRLEAVDVAVDRIEVRRVVEAAQVRRLVDERILRVEILGRCEMVGLDARTVLVVGDDDDRDRRQAR